MEQAIDHSIGLQPPSYAQALLPKEDPPAEQTQTAGQADIEEKPFSGADPPAATTPTATPTAEGQPVGDLLDEVADMNIPKTINMSSFEDDNRANQVVSPDGSTFDGTSTIGSEPTSDTGISRGGSKKKINSVRSTGSRGGNSRSGNSRSGNSRQGGSSRAGSRNSRKGASPNGHAKQAGSSTQRRSYRNAYSGGTRMNQSTVPRPFKRPGPLSYSKAVRLSGTGSPFAGREVDDKTRAVLADMNEFDSAQLETQ